MSVQIIKGDARTMLVTIPAESVQCVVTSPPYWGLRAYGGDPGMIGLEPTLEEHIANLVAVFREIRRVLRPDGTVWLNYGDGFAGSGPKTDSGKQATHHGSLEKKQTPVTGGLKPKDLLMMPARVALALQADGWWVRSEIVWAKPNPMPESVTDRPTSAHEKVFLLSKSGSSTFWRHPERHGVRSQPAPDYVYTNKVTGEETREEPAGWRNDPDWSRRNLWRGYNYFYDAEAVRTPVQPQSIARLNQKTFDTQTGEPKDPKSGNRSHRKVLENLKKRVPAGWASSESYEDQDPRYRRRDGWHGKNKPTLVPEDAERQSQATRTETAGVNLRNVWTADEEEYAQFLRWKAERAGDLTDTWRIPTFGLKEAHFATFPPALVEPCIKAGTSEKGCCVACGAPWVRVVDTPKIPEEMRNRSAKMAYHPRNVGGSQKMQIWRNENLPQTTGWQPTCECNAATRPCMVLDPFAGAGTVGLVAQQLRIERGYNIDCTLIEINAEYAEMARRRIQDDSPLFTQVRGGTDGRMGDV